MKQSESKDWVKEKEKRNKFRISITENVHPPYGYLVRFQNCFYTTLDFTLMVTYPNGDDPVAVFSEEHSVSYGVEYTTHLSYMNRCWAEKLAGKFTDAIESSEKIR